MAECSDGVEGFLGSNGETLEKETVGIKRYEQKRFSIDEGECCINRIDKLNDKIANLSCCLDDFSHTKLYLGLVLNKHASSDPFMKCINAEENEDQENKFGKADVEGKQSNKKIPQPPNTRELEKFAGMYSFKMALSPPITIDSEESHQKRLKKMRDKLCASKSSSNLSKRPMLVELHSFSGYDNDAITPLPSPLIVLDVLKIVTSAQVDLDRKPTFKREFQRFFFSSLSRAILSDTFWWFFCEKYQPTPNSQQKLFNRIAHNYTKLLVQWIGSKYHDTLFKRYPDLLAQSVYSIFCQAFPTSYRQFNEKFRDDLIYLVSLWITGTHPAPRTYEKWNFSGLEPKDMRKGDRLSLEADKKKDEPGIGFNSSGESFNRLSPTGLPKASATSHTGFQSRSRKVSRTNTQANALQPVKQTCANLPIIIEPDRGSFHSRALNSSPTDQLSKNHLSLKDCGNMQIAKGSGSSLSAMPSVQLTPRTKKKKESCKAGRGAEFSKSVFDIYGRSPLMEQFLRSNNLSSDNGIGVLVRRTEIKKLPPPSVQTYHDIITEAQKSSKKLQSQYHRFVEESFAKRVKVCKKQIEIRKDMEKKTKELMSNPSQVKKISELLRLSLLRDQKDGFEMSSAEISAELNKTLGYEVILST